MVLERIDPLNLQSLNLLTELLKPLTMENTL